MTMTGQDRELHKLQISKRRKEYRESHRQEIVAEQHQFYQEHKDEILARQKEYYQRNKDRITRRNAEYRQSHVIQASEYSKLYRQSHKDTARKYAAAYYREHRNEMVTRQRERHWICKVKVLTHYGNGKCACIKCRESRLACLSIDHIDGNGIQHRKSIGRSGGLELYQWLVKNGYPEGYQTLCPNCQFVKKSENKEYTNNNKRSQSIYRQTNRNKILEREKRRRLLLKLSVLAHYSDGRCVCVRCGYGDIRALSIDHIKGNGRKHREFLGGRTFYRWLKVNNYPEGYQTLCMNCQYVKRVEENEYGKTALAIGGI